MTRFTDDDFTLNTVSTVGVDFKWKLMTVNEEEVTVQVWDTAGQERFHKITKAYYRGSHGIVLVYDVTNPSSLENIDYWMKNIRDNSDPRVQTCLVGNKVDLRESHGLGRETVESQNGQQIANRHSSDFFECSAKTGVNVEDAFDSIVQKVCDTWFVKPPTPSSYKAKSKGRIRRTFGHRRNKKDEGERPVKNESLWSPQRTHSPISQTHDSSSSHPYLQGDEVGDRGEHCRLNSNTSTTSVTSSFSMGSSSVSGVTTTTLAGSSHSGSGGVGGGFTPSSGNTPPRDGEKSPSSSSSAGGDLIGASGRRPSGLPSPPLSAGVGPYGSFNSRITATCGGRHASPTPLQHWPEGGTESEGSLASVSSNRPSESTPSTVGGSEVGGEDKPSHWGTTSSTGSGGGRSRGSSERSGGSMNAS
ncbi:unnamed protein product, partial [Discosporangium mesarthrocarpum]